MYKLELQWKDFSIDLEALDAQMHKDYEHYSCNQAQSVLELWFTEEISEEDKSAIQDMWDKLKKNSKLAKSYQSQADIDAEKEAAKKAAKAKLIDLGLTEDDLKALLG